MPKVTVDIRKSLGSYYTPTSITKFLLRYSLQQKVNEIIQSGKVSAKQKDASTFSLIINRLSELKVLDPACGDGAFLFEALRIIENGYRTLNSICISSELAYTDLEENAQQIIANCPPTRIALENLYGVDIDEDAIVSATRRLVSYCIAGNLLENAENTQNTSRCLENALRLNLKVANALKIPPIGWQESIEESEKWIRELGIQRSQTRNKAIAYFESMNTCAYAARLERTLRHQEDRILTLSKHLSVNFGLNGYGTDSHVQDDYFIWELNFSEVFTRENPGFDVVCGNPPYINLEMITNTSLSQFLRKSDRWKSLWRGKGDLQYYFLYLAIQLLRSNGFLAYITSRYWLENKNADVVRKYLEDKTSLIRLIDLGDTTLFDAGIHNLLIILKKSRKIPQYSFDFAKISNTDCSVSDLLEDERKINWMKVLAHEVFHRNGSPWRLLPSDIAEVIKKMENLLDGPEPKALRLEEITHIGEGIKTGNDSVFASLEHMGDRIFRNRFDKEKKQYQFENGVVRPVLSSNKEIIPFCVMSGNNHIICTHKIGTKVEDYPVVKTYLDRFVTNLDELRDVPRNSRPLGKRYSVLVEQYITPYDLVRYNEKIFGSWDNREQNYGYPSEGVIFGRYRNREACFALSETDLCCLTNIVAITPKDLHGCNIRYLLGLLNSQAVDFFIRFGKTKKKGAVQEYRRSTLSDVPIRVPNLEDTNEENIHDLIVTLVEELEKSQKELLLEKAPHNDLQQQYDRKKEKLDQIIFRFYGLSNSAERIRKFLNKSL